MKLFIRHIQRYKISIVDIRPITKERLKVFTEQKLSSMSFLDKETKATGKIYKSPTGGFIFKGLKPTGHYVNKYVTPKCKFKKLR
jgi:hypothetical protein